MTTVPNIRISTWIKQSYPGLTKRQIDEILNARIVKDAMGKRVRKGDRLSANNRLSVGLLDEKLHQLSLGNPLLKVEVILDESDFVVIDKPAGMASQPISLFDDNTVTHWALARFPDIAKEFTSPQPTLTPHRLDQGTCGLLIVAKTKPAYQSFRSQFIEKRIQKKYHAWCWGVAQKKYFEVALSLAHSANDRKKMVAPSQGEKFRKPFLEAQSMVTVKRQLSDRFMAEVTCYTGVTHQVRAHLAIKGYPLIGDPLYDDLFQTRPDKPPYHQLRAIELKSDSFVFTLPSLSHGIF